MISIDIKTEKKEIEGKLKDTVIIYAVDFDKKNMFNIASIVNDINDSKTLISMLQASFNSLANAIIDAEENKDEESFMEKWQEFYKMEKDCS